MTESEAIEKLKNMRLFMQREPDLKNISIACPVEEN